MYHHFAHKDLVYKMFRSNTSECICDILELGRDNLGPCLVVLQLSIFSLEVVIKTHITSLKNLVT